MPQEVIGSTSPVAPGTVTAPGAGGVAGQVAVFSGGATIVGDTKLTFDGTTSLAAESLTNGALTGGASRTRTCDMALAANAATYTHATGAGTLNQASGTLAIAGHANRLYSFTYTVSGLTGTAPAVTITTAFALTAVTLPLTAGANTVQFRSATVPGNFIISVTSTVAGTFTLDDLSLKEENGGLLANEGLYTGGGTLGERVDGSGNVILAGAAQRLSIGTGSSPALGAIDLGSANGDKIIIADGGSIGASHGIAFNTNAFEFFTNAGGAGNFFFGQGGQASFVEGARIIGLTGEIFTNASSGTVAAVHVGGSVFEQTANKVTVANTATSLFGTGRGSLTLPANLLTVGRTIRIKLRGFVSQADTGVGTKTLVLTLGGVTVATGTSGATWATTLNSGWSASAEITCRTTGAGGTVIGGGEFSNEIALATVQGVLINGTTTAACNTTGTLVVDLTLNNGSTPNGTLTTTTATVTIEGGT